MPDNGGDKKNPYYFLARSVQLATTMVFSVVGGVWLGGILDKKFSTYPWLTFIFLVLGVMTAFKAIFDFTREK
ncbi:MULTISPECIES: AtpZ/AtpI family protein [Carboxydothermus]|uniref:F0F1-type ATP synthase assembly protein I n=2 Tax=Carboxydothermus TaxID=129957 RepID=A0ABX2R955_9THEO|nr:MULTISPECIES: AtpZ/AtpI family protein [Carboxydothermus]ABB13860.1 putative membrane protein [Carboxydothermus hydrogenoformans Z-2901]NYE57711.1 F0F1-type ATP synthase assembly protein I [Carboxydothermus ferrireducens DSM 11255]